MNKAKTLSIDEYNGLKKKALDNEPMTKIIKLNDMKLNDDSYKSNYVEIEGKQVKVTMSFFEGLASMLNISKGMKNNMTGRKDEDGSGSILFSKLLGALNTYTGIKRGERALLIANPHTKSIINIKKGEYGRISNSSLFNIVENVMNDHPSIGIKSIDNNPETLKTDIRFVNNREFDFGVLNSAEDQELMQFGFGFENNGAETRMYDYMYRMVCENGMMGMGQKDIYKLDNISGQSIGALFASIKNLSLQNFVPNEFTNKLMTVNKVNASYGEIEKYAKLATDHVGCEDPKDKRAFEKAIEQKFFPGYIETRKKLLTANVKLGNLSAKQKQFINSGQSIWDVINSLTYIGSNDIGCVIDNKNGLQRAGGILFGKEYDLQYAELLKI